MTLDILSAEEEKLWRQIHGIKPWDYDETCSYCGKREYEILKAPETVDVMVWVWNMKCYGCNDITPVVWPVNVDLEPIFESIHFHSFENLPQKISEAYPFFKKVFKKTKNVEDFGNTCTYCGRYQGDWFVMEDYLEIAYTPESAQEQRTIKVDLTPYERLWYSGPKKVLNLHHPRKGSFASLCDDCYRLYTQKKM
ncbi:hypothetical protein J2129_000577 [Methanofollis sp. W23]|uniref:hypothetical protein n=1 Tax=Methanofollis sp. W23 TaxID=2817849 RepID=UPI001AEA4A26|nr:hypothetical protein [Methanofollis sp. W23]MBP2145123.1 hypothetical protein [Methanofollis sp. W23]